MIPKHITVFCEFRQLHGRSWLQLGPSDLANATVLTSHTQFILLKCSCSEIIWIVELGLLNRNSALNTEKQTDKQLLAARHGLIQQVGDGGSV